MKLIERDLLTLSAIQYALKTGGKTLGLLIDDYDNDEVINLTKKYEFFNTGDLYEKALKELASECYGRVRKKFPKK